MNTCETIDYTIRIIPEIDSRPNEIVLRAMVELPNHNVINIQQAIDIMDLKRMYWHPAKMAAASFARKISDVISEQIRGVAEESINDKLWK